ncbi:hypothetical protein MNV49_007206 [Pseudohyphozyma bogoriensis]|nr:hypothetical protein MNV49_007206 [Pseudohyphozyma bogoriensis]
MASPISPELALDLRLRFLETLIAGKPAALSSPASSSSAPSQPSLTRRADLVQAQLKQTLETGGGGEAVRRFVQGYDLNEPLLRLPPVSGQEGDALTPQAKVALILESENEIRQLERELREVDTLDQRGVVGAGKLADHEPLKRELEALQTTAAPLASSYASLEARTNKLLAEYNDYISTLSEIFISWNDIVSSAEEEVRKLERERSKELDYA